MLIDVGSLDNSTSNKAKGKKEKYRRCDDSKKPSKFKDHTESEKTVKKGNVVNYIWLLEEKRKFNESKWIESWQTEQSID